MEYKVNKIYPSFMGEVNPYGIGAPCTFIRLQGCNLRCYGADGGSCDTPEALDSRCYNLYDEKQIVQEVEIFGRPLVCITGGEPLMQNLTPLLQCLQDNNFYVVIETNGSLPIADYADEMKFPRVNFIIDVKCPSTGMAEHFDESNARRLRRGDMFKFVVKDFDDLSYVEDVLTDEFNIFSIPKGPVPCFYVGACWGSEVKYGDLQTFIYTFRGRVGLNMQAHKMVCLYDYINECGKDTPLTKISDLIIPTDI